MFATGEHRAGEASGALPVERIRAAALAAPGCRGLTGGSGVIRELPPGLPRGTGRSPPWGRGGAPRLGPTALLPSVPGIRWARDPLPAPHSWRAAPCPGVSVAAFGSRGLSPRGGVGGGGDSVCFSGSFAFLNPGRLCRNP